MALFLARGCTSLLLVAVVLSLAACGDDTTPPAPVDGGGRDATRRACAADSECDDRLFCNGLERCAGDVCAVGAAPCASGQRCDEFDDACRPCTDADADGDGLSTCEGDCDDADPARYPGASEVCNAVDEDCNDTTFGRDADGDGFESSACCNGTDLCGTDCDDAVNTVNPGAAEACNGLDDDCDGLTDALDGVCVPCGPGYRGTTPECADVDECAEGIAACDQDPVALCENQPGTFLCRCPSGYEGDGRGGAGCAEIDECARELDDCDEDPGAACTNTAGAFTCACPSDYVGDGRGAAGCLLDDAALLSLVAGSTGTLAPAFNPATMSYLLTLVPGATSVTLTPSVSQPARATLVVDGASVVSGAPIDLETTNFEPRRVEIVVTTESGATRTYGVVVARGANYFKASNTDPYDEFGAAIALSDDGNTLAIGAPKEDSVARGIDGAQSDDTDPDAGAVYVFVRGPTGWSQQAYVKASNTRDSQRFGASVALSSDGSTLVVGAPLESSSGVGVNGDQTDTATGTARISRGAAYAFTRAGTTWSQQAYFKSARAGAGSFGSALALAADGNTLAASDPTNNDVHVFTRAGAVWAAQRVLRSTRTDFGDFFGAAVSLAADGNTLAVGAPFEDSNAVGIGGSELNNSAGNSGAAFVFTRTAGTWTQRAYIKASNSEARDLFGTSVALSRDGLTLAVGAPEEDSDATGVGGDQTNDRATESGATYVFTFDGVAWSQQAYVKASNAALGDGFGASVSLASDGATLAIGAPTEDSIARGIGGDETSNAAVSAGAVYVLGRVASVWSQLAYVKASNAGAGDLFGSVLSLSADGESLLISAPQEDASGTGVGSTPDELGADSGAAYLY